MCSRVLTTALTVSFLAALSAQIGCAGGDAPRPQPPTNTNGLPPGPGPGPGPGPATGTGPLATLDPSTAKQESWQLDRGPAPFLNFEAQHLRISAGCRTPTGQMDCDALRFARGGQQVTLAPQEKMRMGAPGAMVCNHIKNQLVTGRDPKGNEDGFCVFPDGSMIATGSLEYHTLK